MDPGFLLEERLHRICEGPGMTMGEKDAGVYRQSAQESVIASPWSTTDIDTGFFIWLSETAILGDVCTHVH